MKATAIILLTVLILGTGVTIERINNYEHPPMICYLTGGRWNLVFGWQCP